MGRRGGRLGGAEMTTEHDIVIEAEAALGENLQWLRDKFDLEFRQGDREVMRRMAQLTAAWRKLARCVPVQRLTWRGPNE